MAIISTLQPYVLILFVYSTIIYLGMGMTLGQLGASFKRWKIILIALGLNLILAPLLALGVGTLFGLAGGAISAVVLINLFCGSPAGAKNADLAGADPVMAISLVAILALSSVIVVPFTSQILLPGITVNAVQVLMNLLLLLVVPLAVGLLLRRFAPGKFVKGLGKVLGIASNVAMVLVILFFLIPSIPDIISAGIVNILVYLLIIALSFGLNYLLTFGSVSDRKTVSLVSITKNFGVAMSIAPIAFADENIMPYVMTYVVILLVFSLPVSLALRKAKGKKATGAATATDTTIGKAGM